MSMFAEAKKIDTNVEPKGKKDDKKRVAIKGLKEAALIDALIKNLAAVKDALDADVKAVVRGFFAYGDARPKNFRGFDDGVEASCELRRRASNRALSDDEVALLEGLEVPYDTVDKVAECFVVNPKYTNDQAVLEKVEKALGKIKDLPEDFIMKQEGVRTRVVTDETIATAYEKGVIDTVLETVAVIAIKPSVADIDVGEAFKVAMKYARTEEDK